MVWGQSKDRQNARDIGKGEDQGLPIKDGTRSESDIFDGIEINGHDEMLKKGAGKNNAPPVAS